MHQHSQFLFCCIALYSEFSSKSIGSLEVSSKSSSAADSWLHTGSFWGQCTELPPLCDSGMNTRKINLSLDICPQRQIVFLVQLAELSEHHINKCSPFQGQLTPLKKKTKHNTTKPTPYVSCMCFHIHYCSAHLSSKINQFLTQRFQCGNTLIENLLSMWSGQSKTWKKSFNFSGLLLSGTSTTQQWGTWHPGTQGWCLAVWLSC